MTDYFRLLKSFFGIHVDLHPIREGPFNASLSDADFSPFPFYASPARLRKAPVAPTEPAKRQNCSSLGPSQGLLMVWHLRGSKGETWSDAQTNSTRALWALSKDQSPHLSLSGVSLYNMPFWVVLRPKPYVAKWGVPYIPQCKSIFKWLLLLFYVRVFRETPLFSVSSPTWKLLKICLYRLVFVCSFWIFLKFYHFPFLYYSL